MNFFMVGSFFMLFMLNAGWTSNYVIKLVGFLFFAVGTAEAEERTDALCTKGENKAFSVDKGI